MKPLKIRILILKERRVLQKKLYNKPYCLWLFTLLSIIFVYIYLRYLSFMVIYLAFNNIPIYLSRILVKRPYW